MVLQIVGLNASLEKVLYQLDRLIPNDESTIARSSDPSELQGYVKTLSNGGLDIGNGKNYRFGYKFLPGESNQTRLIVFKRDNKKEIEPTFTK